MKTFELTFHALILLALLILLRPMFTAGVSASSYKAPSILVAMLKEDIALLTTAAQRHKPAVPHLLFLVIGTTFLLLGQRRIRWDQWEGGASLRFFVCGLITLLVWSGATFESNPYLDQGHLLDRFVLVALCVLSWWTPLAVPFATRWAIVMLKEAYLPIALDDFDFRSLPEVLVVFSCFVWVSFRKSFQTKHFLLVAMGCWASYYYAAGSPNGNYGPPHSWLLENHLSNISVGGYVRGWVGSPIHLLGLQQLRAALRSRALVLHDDVEFGSLGAFFIHPRLARLWFLLLFLLHFGIFVLTGICFWKWMFANLAFWWFLRKGGAPVIRAVCREKVVIAFAIAMVFFSRSRIWFYPQTGVAWYDSRMVENYEIYAIGESGHRYLVDPTSIAPMEMHWVQGRLCEVTHERSATGIYGVTGSYQTMVSLEKLKTPADALKLLAHGKSCHNPERQQTFDEFFQRYYSVLNRHGRRHRWLRWLGAPTHLWVEPQGDKYEEQEPVRRIELWREVVVHHDEKLHRFDKKKVHEVEIPPR